MESGRHREPADGARRSYYSLAQHLNTPVSRRLLLRNAAILSVGASGMAGLLAACGTDDDDEVPAIEPEEDPDEPEEEPDEPAEPDEPRRGGRIALANAADADTLDPHRRRTRWSGQVAQEVCDTVVELNRDLQTFDMILAETWEASDDGLHHTINIRSGIRFHDGTELDAEAVKLSLDRANDEHSTYPGQLHGAEFEVIDDLTLEFTMPEPNSAIFMAMTFNGTAIIHPEQATERSDDLHQGREGPIGTGPFKFKEWVRDERVVLERNDDYQGFYTHAENRGAPYIDELHFRAIPEEETQVAALETGELNVLDLPAVHVRRFDGDDDFYVLRNEQGIDIHVLAFAMPREGPPRFVPPFDDLRLRRAVAHAVDAEEIIEGVRWGQAIRNRSFLPVGALGYSDRFQEMGYDYDPDQAMELLEEAGWALGADGVREKDGERLNIVFYSDARTTIRRMSELIQDQLQRVGFAVDYRSYEMATFLEERLTGNAHIATQQYAWGEPDTIWWQGNDTTLATGRYGELNSEYEEIAREGWRPVQISERMDLYFEATKMMVDDAVLVPLYTPVDVTGAHRSVHDFKLGSQGRHVFLDAWTDED
jgi:peptide/nickel transport system substrate-binding protein